MSYFYVIYPVDAYSSYIYDDNSGTFLPNLHTEDYIIEQYDNSYNSVMRYIWPAYYNSKAIQCTGSGRIGSISGETLQIFNSGDLIVYNNSYLETPPSAYTYELISEHDNVTEIEEMQFRETSIETIRLPYGCKKIGKSAFYECFNLTTVFLYEDVEIFDDYAFCQCSALTHSAHSCANGNSGGFKFGENLKKIGRSCFAGCSSLTAVSFSSLNDATIGENAFANCENLSSLSREYGSKIASDKIKDRIGKNAFYKTNITCQELLNIVDGPIDSEACSWLGIQCDGICG